MRTLRWMTASPPTAPIAAGSLLISYVVARETGVRPLGGAVLAATGAWCTRTWARRAGPDTATAMRNEPLPKSAAGKLLKREFRAPYWNDRQAAVAGA